jgi:hypothetical protein
MEKSTLSRRIVFACALAVTALLAGCPWPLQPEARITTRTETELAVIEVKDEWLRPCAGLSPTMPENNTGNLLLDYNDLSGVSAVCAARHNTLIEYLAPVVAKEKARVLETQKK